MCKRTRPEADPLLVPAQPPTPAVPYSALFRFASPTDKVVLVIGILCSVVNGATMPGEPEVGTVCVCGTAWRPSAPSLSRRLRVFICVVSLCARVRALVFPPPLPPISVFSVFFGRLLDDINTPGDFLHAVTNVAYTFLVLGAIAFVVSFGEVTLMNISATRQIRRVRNVYFKALLRQDVGWYDLTTAGDLASRLAEYVPSPPQPD